MPVLGKHEFVRNEPPEDLKPDEELFYCQLTKEVFRSYDAFFERVILCNSLVWTCSLTGRSGLTFKEAVDSEKQARQYLASCPYCLRRPILYLVTLTKHIKASDLYNDVYNFSRDRFFIGEQVEVLIKNIKKPCRISKVIPSENSKCNQSNSSDENLKSKLLGPDPQKYKYEVIDLTSGKAVVVASESINRTKGSFSRGKTKLLVKQNIEMKDGIWKVKDRAVARYKLNDGSFKDMFAGPLPSFCVSPKKKTVVVSHINNTKSSKSNNKKNKTTKVLNLSKNEEDKSITVHKAKEKITLKENTQQTPINFSDKEFDKKVNLRLEKEREKEKLKEEKKVLAEFISEWKKPREDLECEDNKELPASTLIKCSIPSEYFGDAVMILHFLNRFANLLDLKVSFVEGFGFELLERTLT